MSNGGFVSFLLLVFFRPLEKIAAVVEIYPKGIAGFRSYLDFLETRPDVVDRQDAHELDARELGAGDPGAGPAPVRGEIRYEGVSFGYAPGRPVLKHLSLQIAAGETVAFVGPSGAGKTTVCALLPRFYDVGEGRITIDGTDIRDVTLASSSRRGA
ncbi:ABC-type multidrug transport system fused ATPase/permease subunit [Xanthobacter agilis]|uniref:ABC-type multidrug transport system fused ATPase/permease subunit n=1 Tax=Xanthobacter agilis TaxID=47492 RepID=A0ABU0L9D2_XANAG|nr:ABC-type multidrug transport system fused ATPase/permease subunit [Xanthobacter agilis]